MKYSSKYRLALRIAVSPFILGMLLVVWLFGTIRGWIAFVKYGGEFINYEKDEITSIHEIYLAIKHPSQVK